MYHSFMWEQVEWYMYDCVLFRTDFEKINGKTYMMCYNEMIIALAYVIKI